MIKLSCDIAIVGAGPAGLCAGIEAAKSGAQVILVDENKQAGGQLFKQIHKFFGSKEHKAGTRGYVLGQELVDEISAYPNVRLMLNTTVFGAFKQRTLGLLDETHCYELEAGKIILAAGSMENYLPFPGSTLPGVMGAGAAQTMINIHHVLPGENVVMVGSGNVGLIVTYQLMQAGAKVSTLLEAAPKIGGYGVHASKLARNGVRIMTSHTVTRALGTDRLEAAVIQAVDERFAPIPGTEETVPCDTLCLAVGLSPMTELASMAGCAFCFESGLGGHIPMHNNDMQTTNPRFYVAGDICGVEEASTAMEEGRLAGVAAAQALGFIENGDAERRKTYYRSTLDALRSGAFGQRRYDGVKRVTQRYAVFMGQEVIG